MGSKVYWTCREHAVHGCRSRAITQGQRVTVMRSHCHPPDMEGLKARRQQEKTIKKIQARRIGAGDLEDCDDIEDSLLQGVDSLFYRRGQGTLTLSRSRSRKRAKEHQESLQESPEEDQDVDPSESKCLGTCWPELVASVWAGGGREKGEEASPVNPPLLSYSTSSALAPN